MSTCKKGLQCTPLSGHSKVLSCQVLTVYKLGGVSIVKIHLGNLIPFWIESEIPTDIGDLLKIWVEDVGHVHYK